MATHPRLNQLLRLIDRAPSAFDPEPASTPPATVPLHPHPEVCALLDDGQELTTGQVISRMGLFVTPALEARVAAGLAELGYHRITRLTHNARVAVQLWTATAPVPGVPTLQMQMRRVHEDSDRARGLTPIGRRPGAIARLIRRLRGAK